MIEAVNSVLANAQVLRGNAGHVAVEQALSVVSSDDDGEVTVPQAPFVSPYIAVDLDTNTAVLQIRDSDTGDVIRQFPSETRLQARQQEEVSQNVSAAPVVEAPTAPQVAQAQVASQALAAGAQAGVENLSAGVSVLA